MFYIGLEPFTYKYVKLLIGVMVFLSTASELSPKSGRIQDPLNFKITISGSFLIFSQPVIVVVLDATGVAFAANSACMFNFVRTSSDSNFSLFSSVGNFILFFLPIFK